MSANAIPRLVQDGETFHAASLRYLRLGDYNSAERVGKLQDAYQKRALRIFHSSLLSEDEKKQALQKIKGLSALNITEESEEKIVAAIYHAKDTELYGTLSITFIQFLIQHKGLNGLYVRDPNIREEILTELKPIFPNFEDETLQKICSGTSPLIYSDGRIQSELSEICLRALRKYLFPNKK